MTHHFYDYLLLIENRKIEKDLGFLRIGSLNVRVKKTTEAFSNFLGVGTNNNHGQYSNTVGNGASHRMLHARNSVPKSHDQYDKLHKNWGSADNIPPSVSQQFVARILQLNLTHLDFFFV